MWLKINIFININDKKYKRALIDYICEKYLCFQVFDFEDIEEIAAYAGRKDIETDVLLTDNEEAIIEHAKSFRVAAVLKTAVCNDPDHIINCAAGDNNILKSNSKTMYLFKYQSGDDIINKIISAFDTSHRTEELVHKKNNISAVLGLHGGAGKSLVAASLSLVAALKKSKSLYINFESFHYELFFTKKECETNCNLDISSMNMTKLVYYLKDANSLFQSKAHTCISHGINGVDFVKSASNITDISELDGADADNFIKWLRASEYDNIFFDLPGYISEMTSRLLDFCDNIILVESRPGYDEESGKIIEFINKRHENSKTLKKPNIIFVTNCADRNNYSSNTEIYENNMFQAYIPFCTYIPQRFNETDIAKAFENDKNYWSAINRIFKMTEEKNPVVLT